MKESNFVAAYCLVGLFVVFGVILAERVIREHLTLVDVLLKFLIPTIIVGAIINFPVWWLYGRKPKK